MKVKRANLCYRKVFLYIKKYSRRLAWNKNLAIDLVDCAPVSLAGNADSMKMFVKGIEIYLEENITGDK